MYVRREEPSPTEAAVVASKAFGMPLTPNYEERVASVVTKGHYYAARENGELIGFLVVRPYEDLNYIDGTAVLPEYQAHGVAHSLGLAVLTDFPSPFVAMLTQSIHAYRSVAEWCSSTFPEQGAANLALSRDFESPVKTLVTNEGRAFPLITGFYPSDFYGEKPRSKDTELQEWWDSLAHFDEGDAIYVVGRLADEILYEVLRPGVSTVERPRNPLVRVFRTSGAFFPDRESRATFEAVSYSGVYSHKGWENRLANLSPDCRVITEALYREFPELHTVFFARAHVTCEMSPGYEWTEHKESRIIEILTL